LGDVQLGDLYALDRPVRSAPGDRLAAADPTVAESTDRDPPDVRGRVEVRDVRLQRVDTVVKWGRDVLEQEFEQRAKVGADDPRSQRGAASLGVRVDDRELDLRLVGI